MFWGTAVCQGISPAWHWVLVGLLTGLLTSKRILQSAVKTSFPRRLGYHRSIKCFLQFFTFIRVSWGCSEMGPDVPVGHTA